MADSGQVPSQTSGEQPTTEAPPSATERSVRNESIKAANISDQASGVDSLGFQPYVEAIAEFLTNEDTQPPLTLSVEGSWGSGKSSFMKQLQAEIERIERQKNKPVPRMVWFNAWRHDKVEALWAAFALEFLRQISTPRNKA
ncbi:MAG TPA: P-loop NTPase fold protein, partial [Allocoleopsis sp.]